MAENNISKKLSNLTLKKTSENTSSCSLSKVENIGDLKIFYEFLHQKHLQQQQQQKDKKRIRGPPQGIKDRKA